MRNTVQFGYEAPFVGTEPDGAGVLAVGGAAWFVELLRRIPGLDVDPALVQEDWGVVAFARRDGRSFWIGISGLADDDWIAHVHHGSFAWLQRLSRSGAVALAALATDLDRVLREARASDPRWFDERDHALRDPAASPAG